MWATSSTSAATTRWTRPTRLPCWHSERGLDLVGIGGPKTIDNDVGDSEFQLIDHTPGYGSAAKYWMHAVQYANEENCGSCPADPVLVLQAMGRKIGFIPAAARLADPRSRDAAADLPGREPLHAGAAGRQRERSVAPGRSLPGRDQRGFRCGRVGLGPRFVRARAIQCQQDDGGQRVVNYLNEVGLACRGAARGNVPGTDQRHSMAYASTVDLDEAYRAGQTAALLAARGESGFMATILRNPGRCTACATTRCRWRRSPTASDDFPRHWIAESGMDVTDDFVRYARPLVGEAMVSSADDRRSPADDPLRAPLRRHKSCRPTCRRPPVSLNFRGRPIDSNSAKFLERSPGIWLAFRYRGFDRQACSGRSDDG